jgi:hypothetical protein
MQLFTRHRLTRQRHGNVTREELIRLVEALVGGLAVVDWRHGLSAFAALAALAAMVAVVTNAPWPKFRACKKS